MRFRGNVDWLLGNYVTATGKESTQAWQAFPSIGDVLTSSCSYVYSFKEIVYGFGGYFDKGGCVMVSWSFPVLGTNIWRDVNLVEGVISPTYSLI